MSRATEPATPFQLMPALPKWEYEALKESIRKHGVIVPIIKDEHGTIIDGHHRDRVCRELRIKNVPTITLAGLTTDQKRDHALVLNLVRRKISRKQMRAIIATELRRTPDISNQWLGEIVGSTDKTVQTVRKKLIEASEIPMLQSHRAKDGKRYPATRIYSERAKHADRARAALETLGDDAPRRPVSLRQLERAAKHKKRRLAESIAYTHPSDHAQIRLYHSDFRDLEAVGRIKPGSVDLILTDVPYDKGFVENFSDLAAFASRVLRDGGLFACYVGVVQVAEAIRAFTTYLEYQATAFSVWSGDGPVLQNLQCVVQSTPVLIFTKGPTWARTTRWSNVYRNTEPEQDLHEWQKPLADVQHWLLSFSEAGDLICDPFAGSGTTALACHRNDRIFVGGDSDVEAIQIAQYRLRNAQSRSIESVVGGSKYNRQIEERTKRT